MPIHELIKNNIGLDRNVHIVHGKVDADEREEIRHLLETVENDIIVATYKTLSTGANFKRLHNIIFIGPSKARIKILQSIGRLLRLSKHKSVATIYDIADDFRWKGSVNYTMEHFKERMMIYAEEGFDCKVINVKIHNSMEEISKSSQNYSL